MKKYQKLFLLALVLLVPFTSHARNFYGGLQYSALTYSESGISDLNPSALVVRVGEVFQKSFAVEGRFGIALSDDTFPGLGADFEISKLAGLYGVGFLELSKEASLYGLIGYSKVQQRFSPTVRRTYSEYDVSYGIGLDYDFSDVTALNVEYTSYVDKPDFGVNALSIGFTYTF